jgi:hypothetical protein
VIASAEDRPSDATLGLAERPVAGSPRSFMETSGHRINPRTRTLWFTASAAPDPANPTERRPSDPSGFVSLHQIRCSRSRMFGSDML